ncbi:MAG TPA: glycosyltransferase [Thermoanaerobaculia bacterium]|jgi:glycosyltransferase involved in cell wall biosynthesis|nr:glycosyltransferase [Thermoanaerobaculia bacterium]
MHILWVKVGGLWPLNTGGRLRSFHLINELSQRHRVTVLTTHGPADDPSGLSEHLPACDQIISVPWELPKKGSTRFAMALMRSWFSAYPVDLWKCRIPPLAKEVKRLLKTGVDVCIADFLAAVPNVPMGDGVPVVLFEHNVEHLIWQRLTQHEKSPWRRALLGIESSKMRRREADACRRADLTLAVSETDGAVLHEIAPAAKIAAVPTGVDTSYFTPNGGPSSDHALVFTGSLDWFPNEDAILYFLEEMFPAIRESVKDVTLTVVGRNPSAKLTAAMQATDGARLTGTVDDVRPYVHDGAVFVVPLRIGSGTRLKIFEALAMGKAVVSTSIGAEGLGLEHGTHFLQADTPRDFASAVISLLRDPARRDGLGHAARSLVETHYSWPQVSRRFEELLQPVQRTSS